MSKSHDYYCTRDRSVKSINKSKRNVKSYCSDCGEKTNWARVDHKGSSSCLPILFLIVSAIIYLLFVTCAFAQEYINPKTEVYSYRFRFTKLQPNTLSHVDTLFIGKTVMSFEWIMTGKLLKYEDQAEPVAFAKFLQIDSLIFDIDASTVIAWTDTTFQYITRTDLIPGEWQCQLAASRWDSTKNIPIWSKFSDAVAFIAVKEYVPFDMPVFFKIKFK